MQRDSHTTTPTAVVTGGSRGLGLALVRALATGGWRVVTDARDGKALGAAAGDLEGVTAVTGDVADIAHRRALARAVGDTSLDALILNAGILGPSPLPRIDEYPLDLLTRVYEVNVVAQVGLLQALLPRLRPGAVVIGITSDAAVQPYGSWAGYGSSKAALDQVLHIFGAEHPDLRVYAADPGDMRTRMHAEAFPGEDISDRPEPEASVPGLRRLLAGDLPSGRYAASDLEVPVS